MKSPLLTAERIVAATVIFVLLYALLRGPERFSNEAFGTLIISPAIYTRILPAPINHWLLWSLLKAPLLSYLFYAIPVLMLAGATLAGIVAIRRDSVRHAYFSLLLVSTVFGVYHLIQPLGMTFKTF